jgi:hypothetical protein
VSHRLDPPLHRGMGTVSARDVTEAMAGSLSTAPENTVKGEAPTESNASVLAIVHNEETPLSIVCQSPLCSKSLESSGPKVRPRQFCSDECRQFSSLLCRVKEKLQALSDC